MNSIDYNKIKIKNIFFESKHFDGTFTEGKKLKENWIFIDLLHFWKMQDVDILEGTTKIIH